MIKLSLENIRVLDFTWQVMGPVCTKYLADLGAEVIKIESSVAFDAARGNLPYREGTPGINRSCHYAWLNSSKRSITINLKKPQGSEMVKKLVSLSNVVIENFTPGTMERLSLSYEELKRVNPEIIMVSLSSAGQTGPYRLIPGLGNFVGAWAGLNKFLGMPGREPIIGYVPHPDYFGAHAGVIAIIGSLLYQRRTGKGQHIDISMLEASIPSIAPAILDYEINGREALPSGNRLYNGAPHGIYRCSGNDRWCSISIFNDDEWENFVTAIGSPPWASEAKFAGIVSRKENEDELDRNIEAWTINHTAEEVMSLLQSNGVAAGVVQNGRDLINDPQLEYRQHLQKVEGHLDLDMHYSSTSSFMMSKTTMKLKPAPGFGQDNEYVFMHILGLPDDEYIDLINSGVIE